LPRTEFVDLRDRTQWQSPKLPWITRGLVSRIEATLRSGQQALLYLNRLGFAHFLFCPDCGHTWRCRNCDVALTYYQNPPTLKCHYCSSTWSVPKSCELCEGVSLDTIGVGTEQAEKELKIIFPEARIARFDRSVIKTRRDLEAILGAISRREIDIVVGTQMIAKGHDFPGIALVGILVADASLNVPDFRANERTFQIITQVSGRAGRAEVPGSVVIQTINPEHPVLAWAAGNRSEEFYRAELETRRAFGFPPYQRMAMLRFQHRNSKAVEQFAVEVAQFVKTRGRCQAVGPSEAPLARLKNLYRWQCLIKSETVKNLQVCLLSLREYVAYRKSPVQFAIDVDPVNAM
jgi:primosomal protein N' (replication factor Y)